MTPEALEQLFVGKEREKLLQDVLRKIKASATRDEKHFVLLVGPRGIGKTHFLGLLHHRLTTTPQLAAARKKLKIAFLKEEEWGVASFLDLLVSILRALSEEDGSDDISARIDEIRRTFARDPERARELGERHLIEVVGKRTLLVLCENLSDLFHGLGDEGQKRLRAFIQEHGFFTIVATTQALFRDIQLRESPFHGFFTIRTLDRLDFETSLELLRKKAELDGRTELAAALTSSEGRARARAIHHLANGNARVYVTMSEFLDHESLDDLVRPFMGMVDDLTPYYQERMRQVTSPQQRKIVDFLAQARGAVPVKEIASQCLISQQVAAKQLGELAKASVVRSERDGRETRYELAEPLMRICFEVKDNRTKHLRSFVDLLRDWFSSRELQEQLVEIERSTGRELDRIHALAALEEAQRDGREPLLDALHSEATRSLERDDPVSAASLAARIVDERGEEADFLLQAHALLRTDRATELERVARDGLARFPVSPAIQLSLAWALRQQGKQLDALAVLDPIRDLDLIGPEARSLRLEILDNLARRDEVVEAANEVLRLDPQNTYALRMKVHALFQLERWEEVEEQAQKWSGVEQSSPEPFIYLTSSLLHRGHPKRCLDTLDIATMRGLNHGFFFSVRCASLIALGLVEEALSVAERWRAEEPQSRYAILMHARSLKGVAMFEEAERVLRDGCAASPENASVQLALVDVLTEQGRFAEAADLLDRTAVLVPEKSALIGARISLLSRSKQVELALRTIHEAQELGVLRPAAAAAQRYFLLSHADRTDEIEEELTSPVDDESKAVAAFWRGLLHAKEGDFSAATEAWRSLASLDLATIPTEVLGAAEGLLRFRRPNDALDILPVRPDAVAGSRVSGLRAASLVMLARYAEASAVAADAGAYGAVASLCAITGERGLSVALEIGLGPILRSESPAQNLAELLRIEAKEHGPRSLAECASAVTDALTRADRLSLWSAALTKLVHLLVQEENALAHPAWIEAVQRLRSALAGIPDCELPLSMLEAVARYRSTGDRSALLDLPLELRTLIAPADDQQAADQTT